MKRVIANDLSKLYVHGESSTISLQHAFTQAWRKWSGKAWEEKISKIPEQRRGPRPGTFWAIQDVSLEIGMGETVGLLGPNGAGKSTLVRVLGRLTEPSSGAAVIEGRVASVLEVGAGFHPDLTGRENALLNGALLGMRRKRLEEKMDSILAFAGVEAYADTAVKYYSSGMQYRLAVSVALHLEADFLMLDEVLEVADLEFEDRCQKRMAEMQALGHSFLFVTHNRTQLEKFCSRLYWMEQGRVRTSGNTKDVLADYQQETRR